MTPSLDLFVLTFNCAKNLINVAVFSAHLRAALSQNATGLPDLVVFSLQEVAPLSYAFIGSYFLSSYYSRFEEALNLAATQVLATSPPPPALHDQEESGRGHQDANDAAVTTPFLQRGGTPGAGRTPSPYTLVRAKNVGMTAIMLFARDPTAVRAIEEAECGFGAADMGNKGAVGLRVTWGVSATRTDAGVVEDEVELRQREGTTELTFVSTHLAAMEWNMKKRNSNWRSIVSSLTFANPRDVLPSVFPRIQSAAKRDGTGDNDQPVSEEEEEEEEEDGDDADSSDAQPLLNHIQTGHTASGTDDGSPSVPRSQRQQNHVHQQRQTMTTNGEPVCPDDTGLTPTQEATLHDMSVFRPTAHLFVAGDLNYRISATTPPPLATFPSFDAASPHYFPTFLSRDQLTQERVAGRAFHGLVEHPVTFGPTYKFNVLPEGTTAGATNAEAVREAAAAAHDQVPEVVPWRFAPHRWPAWCDRVLYLDVPPWVAGEGEEEEGKAKIEVLAYDALPVIRTSDHRPVFLRARVPLLGPDKMRPPSSLSSGDDDFTGEDAERMKSYKQDPRVSLPVPIDVHAWERRAAARRREVVVGWTAFLWSTREGALVLATLLAVGAGVWVLWRVW